MESKVVDIEEFGMGKLGEDDLFVEVAGVEFRFCNDCDVHLGFDQPLPLVEDFYSRWQSIGYDPAEWIKNKEKGPGTRVRGGKVRDA